MRNKVLFGVTLLFTVLVTACRMWQLPLMVPNAFSLTRISYLLVLVMTVAAATVLFLGFSRRPLQRKDDGESWLLTGGGVAFGASLAGMSVWDIFRFMVYGRTPAPELLVINTIDRTLLIVSLLAGLLGGAFLVLWFIGRWVEPQAPLFGWRATVLTGCGCLTGVLSFLLFVRGYRDDVQALQAQGYSPNGIQGSKLLFGVILGVVLGAAVVIAVVRYARRGALSGGWFWLLPALWAFARMARYNVVYASKVDVSAAVYECFLYAVAMLFLHGVARHLAGVGTPTRWLKGLAAATAIFALSASSSRLLFWCMGERLLVAYCPIPGVTEWTLGLFALTAVVCLCTDDSAARHYK